MNFTYNEKINIIGEFFGISPECSRYIYHRRRKGYPYKKKEDDDYLEWNIQIQNGFVLGDLSNIDYTNIHFIGDIISLKEKYNIDITSMPCEKVLQNKIKQKDDKKIKIRATDISHDSVKLGKPDGANIDDDEDGNEWCLVTTKKTLHVKKNILKKMGFIVSLQQIENNKKFINDF
jgi:hypothetical protein